MLQIHPLRFRFRNWLRAQYHVVPLPIGFKRSLLRRIYSLCHRLRPPVKVNYPDQATTPQDLQGILQTLKFATVESPLISIVIPCYGKLAFTLNCLKSLQEHPPCDSYEVLVVDDATPDLSYGLLSDVPGLRLIRNEKNLGYIKSCNRAAELARGSYLHFLNNDTVLLDGSIDELVTTFKLFPQSGLVGSRLIYPDGVLQEVGGVVWKDGSATNLGRFGSPDQSCYRFLQEVDYCSGASIMVPRSLFKKLGGFDLAYEPAYYEDTDLAMKISSLGFKIICQPLSTVIHYEGVSHGRDHTSGIKHFQDRNKETFLHRWQSELSLHQAYSYGSDDANSRRCRGRILLIDATIPRPDEDAGSVCEVNLMLLLRSLGFQPTFWPDNSPAVDPPYSQLLEGLGIEVLAAPFTKNLRHHLKEKGSRYDSVVLFRPEICKERIALIRRYCASAAVIYYPHDLHYWRFEREALTTNQPELMRRAQAYRKVELSNTHNSDLTILLSSHEKKELEQQLPSAKIRVLPLILGKTATKPHRHSPPFGSLNLVFIGNFRHSPNQDAVMSFCADVLPLVLQTHPEVRLHVVGANPTAEVLALSSGCVVVHGYVDDLDEFLSTMHVSVVPLRFGAGVKGKIGTALTAALPVVSTPVGVEGIPVKDGEHLLVADDPQAMAQAIGSLIVNEGLRQRLGEAGRRFAEDHWGERANLLALGAILRELGLDPSPVPLLEPLPLSPMARSRWPGQAALSNHHKRQPHLRK